MKDFDVIMAFKKMRSISEICKDLGIEYSNLIRGNTTLENEHKVVQELKLELYKLNLFMGEK